MFWDVVTHDSRRGPTSVETSLFIRGSLQSIRVQPTASRGFELESRVRAVRRDQVRWRYHDLAQLMSARPFSVLTDASSLEPVGGIEVSTLQDALALAERGHRIDLMYRDDGSMRAAFEAGGINLHGPVDFAFNTRRPWQIANFAGAARWARSRHPDVVWLNRFENIVWARTVARWSSSPIVCHLHHSPNFNRTALLARPVAHFIAVSQFMRSQWIAAGVDPAAISVVNNALPEGQYLPGGLDERRAARRRLGLEPEITLVLYYGRISTDKGVDVVLDAWRRLDLDPSRSVLLLMGEPEPTTVAGVAATYRDLDPTSVRWIPGRADVTTALHAADVVVFSSRLDEGFGRVVVETLSTGRPVVASNVGAVPEVLSGTMSRFLVPVGDAGALADRVSSLLEWRTREPELSRECSQWARERFPYQTHIDAIEEILERYERR